MSAQNNTLRKLATGIRCSSGYLICPCGAWNSVDGRDRCYMCRTALYADMPETESPSVIVPKQRLQINEAIARAHKLCAKLESEREKYSRYLVVCLGDLPRRKPDNFLSGAQQFVSNGCGAELPVSELTFIQTHWYTPPYGCTGGDYWNVGEGKFKCPKCGAVNRLIGRQDVLAIKMYFGKHENVYDR